MIIAVRNVENYRVLSRINAIKLSLMGVVGDGKKSLIQKDTKTGGVNIISKIKLGT